MPFKGLNGIHFKHHLMYSPHRFLSEAVSSWTASFCSCPQIQFQTSFTLFPLFPPLALLQNTLFHVLHQLNWTRISSPVSLYALSRLHPSLCESAPSVLHFTTLCSSLSCQSLYTNIMQIYQRQKMLLPFYLSHCAHILICSLM